ncbi:MAG: transcription regulator protein [Acidobacteria bacterium]|nr:transcription regulator protein [Acidobacteriota bacterium]
MQAIPKKLYYRIGEVIKIVGVEAHVLRYWETEFPGLAPPKNKAGQRTYRPKDIEQLLMIRQLLYEEGYTIAGARKRLARSTREPAASATPQAEKPAGKVSGRPPGPAQGLSEVRQELEKILTLLERE